MFEKNNVKVGDSIKITADLTYSGILMPRYESGDDKHLVVKLGSGYNAGINVDDIQNIEIVSSSEVKPKQDQERKDDPTLPKILLLSTGGTIASKIDYRTGAVTPALSASDLNEAVPELGKIANIDAEVLFSEYSENLQPDHWTKIAEKLDSLADSDYKGILIAHGTDTMHYTSSFLSFALAGFPIPVALVGSQRSSDRPSSDAAINLIAASKFLVESNTKGIFLVMHHNDNDQTVACHAGTRVRKNHTSKRGAFETMGGNPAFIIAEGKIKKNIQDDFFKNEKYNPRMKIDTKVSLVKYHPGYDPQLIENLIQTGCKAIIFEGTGLGHVGRTMYDVVKNAKENDLFLGMTSQCIDGRVRMTVYESGRDLLDLGITPLENMTPETSLVKAMWALGNSKDADGMKSLMLKNIASEF
uniref:Glutamyl-tRNA(Gln) amidotransferase subunit D n=1 Tax=uncultured marine thaumarchaeote AD1000_14_F02 TaxID=1455892 RepID=A0A075FPN1_9ARCH|nr:glutamyl-tRNA(Gln) amidotransferase subunit D (gatD) [uncultured marine thaumarchaeote AD1000_14_F02]